VASVLAEGDLALQIRAERLPIIGPEEGKEGALRLGLQRRFEVWLLLGKGESGVL
jgi:hypothetical protein